MPLRHLTLLASAAALAVLPLPDSPAAQAQDTTPTALSPVDQLAIIDMIGRMNHAIDEEDYAKYASFYAEDGVIDSGFGPATQGHAAIVASLGQSRPFITNKRHVPGNITIDGDGEMATATYYLTVFERKASLDVAGTALIVDQFRKGPAGWQVIRHTTRMDPSTLDAMMAGMQAMQP